MNAPRLLLLSSSTVHGAGYLDYAEAAIRDFFGPARRIVFVPYALADRAGYATRAKSRLDAMGFDCRSIEDYPEPAAALDAAEAIFIGGGNTFRLLKALYDYNLIDAIRRRVQEGMIYMGASAGSNVACPTIRTTNDMPIVEPPSLRALTLFPWQINPHYIDADPASTHMGETREERLLQYLEENETPVIALREGAMIRMEGGMARLIGTREARLFRRTHPPEEITPPAEFAL
jgi:dipeptidase E